MPYGEECGIYNKLHVINILHENGVCSERNLVINITECNDVLQIRIRDANEYQFNYSALIDSMIFEKMKQEQSLEISLGEFKPQVLELLKLTELQRMLVRLEVYKTKSRMVFYEKARLKSLIFLVVDFDVTDQSEIIKEMCLNIQHLKSNNCSLTSEISVLKQNLSKKNEEIKIANTKQAQLQKQFCKHLQEVDVLAGKNLLNFQLLVQTKLNQLSARVFKLVKETEVLKERDQLRRASCARLNQTLQTLQTELNTSRATIDNLHVKLQSANDAKLNADQQICEVKMELSKRNDLIQGMEEKIKELKKDMQNATLIIAQKSKTNDELARDLVQANQMIVNFNNHFDKLAAETESLRQQLKLKDDVIAEQKTTISKLREEHDGYKNTVRVEEILQLKEELLQARKEIENLEKQNREVSKLNAVLTRKLAGTNMWKEYQ